MNEKEKMARLIIEEHQVLNGSLHTGFLRETSVSDGPRPRQLQRGNCEVFLCFLFGYFMGFDK